MAKTEAELRQQLSEALRPKPVTILAEVKAVDDSKRTCDIDDDGVIMYGIRLQPITQGSTGITVYPKVGSQVLCSRIEDEDNYMVVHASEIDKIEIKVSDKSLVLDKDGIVANGGTIGSVKADKMVEWMSKVYADIISIQTTLGSLAGQAAFSIPFTNAQTPNPQVSDFADDSFKH